ncbi:MAG: hypothetical protein II889_06820 [Clostridia bacterium]|nr:hypothetical protein [Clostridia bacterium]
MKRVFLILVLILVFTIYAMPGSGEVTSAVTGGPLAGRETVRTQQAVLPSSDPVSSVEGVPVDDDLVEYRPATDTGLCLFSFRCPAEWMETAEVTCRRLPGERYSVSLNLPGHPDPEERILTFLLCEHGKTDVTKMPLREIASLRDDTGRTLDLIAFWPDSGDDEQLRSMREAIPEILDSVAFEEGVEVLLTANQATEVLHDALAKAYADTYGSLTEPEDSDNTLRQVFWELLTAPRVLSEDESYYVYSGVTPFRVDKRTGDIYKHIKGPSPMTVPFDPEAEDALTFRQQP